MEISDWISLSVTLATMYLGWTTWKMAKVTQKTLDERSKPYVIVYARIRTDTSRTLEIVIENVGFSPAYNVSFDISENLLHHCWGIDEHTTQAGKKFSSGPFVNGIPMLVPNQKLTIDWGQYGGIKKSLEGREATIIARYQDENAKKFPPVMSLLDIKEFEVSNAYTPTETRKANAAEKISKNLESLHRVIDKKLTPQSPVEAYKWAYIAYLLLQPRYHFEYLYPLGQGAGLTGDQMQQAQEEAHKLVKQYKPELVEEE